MKICIILEGCYPYVYGGVSSWIHDYIMAMPEHQFVLWVIADSQQKKGQFVYQLPANVTTIREVFLDDALAVKGGPVRRLSFSSDEKQALKEMIMCAVPDWEIIFKIFQQHRVNYGTFLRSQDFLDLVEEVFNIAYPYAAFLDLFHTIRSMLLPVLFMMTQEVPEADLYHAICTGYGGLLGALGSWSYRRPFILTEHGIYTREREEEIIRSDWIMPYFKDHWIMLFKMLAKLAYQKADRVTALFQRARETQIDLGCAAEKCRVIRNGIRCERFSQIRPKRSDGHIDIGAVVRIARIKDIKTLLYAFHELSLKLPNARLHIIGPVDDEAYKEECLDLISSLAIHNVLFTGMVKITEYMENLDFVVLSSISEGQPLSVIEAFAAHRPCITTDVGCCRELIHGEAEDTLGAAGICVPPLNKTALVKALETLACDEELRVTMGTIANRRASDFYQHQEMLRNYQKVYQEVLQEWPE